MKMDVVAGSGNNEYYTPPYAIKPIIKYLKPHSTIWCPFDTEESSYVRRRSKMDHNTKLTFFFRDDFFR